MFCAKKVTKLPDLTVHYKHTPQAGDNIYNAVMLQYATPSYGNNIIEQGIVLL
jgi:hypothetical protein